MVIMISSKLSNREFSCLKQKKLVSVRERRKSDQLKRKKKGKRMVEDRVCNFISGFDFFFFLPSSSSSSALFSV